MPKAKDLEFEELIVKTTLENKLQPSDYFVQNVVDVQDLLAIRHCIFAIGSSGSNKSESWKTLANCWTAQGKKTRFYDVNPKVASSKFCHVAECSTPARVSLEHSSDVCSLCACELGRRSPPTSSTATSTWRRATGRMACSRRRCARWPRRPRARDPSG